MLRAQQRFIQTRATITNWHHVASFHTCKNLFQQVEQVTPVAATEQQQAAPAAESVKEKQERIFTTKLLLQVFFEKRTERLTTEQLHQAVKAKYGDAHFQSKAHMKKVLKQLKRQNLIFTQASAKKESFKHYLSPRQEAKMQKI